MLLLIFQCFHSVDQFLGYFIYSFLNHIFVLLVFLSDPLVIISVMVYVNIWPIYRRIKFIYFCKAVVEKIQDLNKKTRYVQYPRQTKTYFKYIIVILLCSCQLDVHVLEQVRYHTSHNWVQLFDIYFYWRGPSGRRT